MKGAWGKEGRWNGGGKTVKSVKMRKRRKQWDWKERRRIMERTVLLVQFSIRRYSYE